MPQALENSYSGGTKRKVSLGQAKDLLLTHLLYQFLNYQDDVINPYAPSIYIEGTMGIGKSMIQNTLTQEISYLTDTQWGFIDLRMAGMSGTDIQGIPIPVKENGVDILVWVKDALLPGIRKSTCKHGILFLDEINQVEDSSVTSLLYQLLLDKKMNDYTLPEGWVIVSAGNRAEDGGVYNRLKAPIRDRMLILEIQLNKQEWIDWSKQNHGHVAVISFVDMKYQGKEVLHTYDPELEEDGDEECANYVFATPRSWHQVSTELHKYEKKLMMPKVGGLLYPKPVLDNTVAGLIGDELGRAFIQFYDTIGSIDINKYCNMEWVNCQPIGVIDDTLTADNLRYLATYVEINGTLEEKINIIYLLAHNNLGYLVMVLQNSLSDDEIKEFRDKTVKNGNSALISQVGTNLDD